jgi:predicted signal transduction protein with EAL and GGDEF domain
MPHRIGERVVVIGASIGAAVFNKGDVSCAELIGAADAVLYRAKTHHVACR